MDLARFDINDVEADLPQAEAGDNHEHQHLPASQMST